LLKGLEKTVTIILVFGPGFFDMSKETPSGGVRLLGLRNTALLLLNVDIATLFKREGTDLSKGEERGRQTAHN
jgi:hypothetical protein